MPLGLSFSPEWGYHSVIKTVKEDGLAATVLKPGDVVKRFNGAICGAPANTAKMLRESVGRIEFHIVPVGKVEYEEMREVEEETNRAAEAALAAAQPPAAPHEYAETGEGESEGESEYGSEYEEHMERERERMNTTQPPRHACSSFDPFPASPTRPSAVSTGPGARRLPASLSQLSPKSDVAPSPQHHSMMPPPDGMGPTSTTRSGVAPLGVGNKPQGWREWLQQRRAAKAAVTRPSDMRENTEQRV